MFCVPHSTVYVFVRACSVMSDSLQPPWTVITHQAPQSMGFPRQDYRSRLTFPSPVNYTYTNFNMHTYIDMYTFHGHEFEQILGDSGGQRSLEEYSPWNHKESDVTQRPSNTWTWSGTPPFSALWRYCIFYKLKVCCNPRLSDGC